ncbi:MAG: GIY-YIG nuclease family protein [Flavobacteriales bacterium]
MYVYILKCSDGSYYTGVTNDMERRLNEHESRLNPDSYTASRLPLTLAFVERVSDPNQAIAIEKQIKGWSRKKKEALINGDFDLLVELSKRRTSSKNGDSRT